MQDSVSAGQPIPRSVPLWNNIIEVANYHAGQKRLGSAGPQSQHVIPTDVVKIKNSSGAHIRRGDVLEITGLLISEVVRESLWFDGAEPDGTRPFAIAMQDIPTSSIDRAHVSGACVARVNVTNADHGYADTADGESVLQSAEGGPVRILYKPTGTGEKVCAVVFQHHSHGTAASVGYITTAITARSGTTPGSGTVQPKKVSSGALADDGGTITVYSWVGTASGTNRYVFFTYDAHGVPWFTGEDC